MVRGNYLKYRAQHHYGNILWEFYLNGCKERGLKPYSQKTFLESMQIYQIKKPTIVDDVVRYYDKEYSVVIITDKNNNIVKVF